MKTRHPKKDDETEDLVDEEDEEQVIDDPPTSINPYRVLEVEKEATNDQIKTAYRKAALKHHPGRFSLSDTHSTRTNRPEDKVPESEKAAANIKFQQIAFAYAVLSDARRRSRYDATGRTSESLDLEDDDFNWTDFFRAQFKEVVTAGAIEKFKREYVGSEEEKLAVIEAYVNGEGSMEFVFAHVMLSDPIEDEARFRAIIDAEIADKRVEAYNDYINETKASRKKRERDARKEAKEAELMAKELGVDGKLFGNKKTNGAANSKKSKDAASGTENEDLGGLAALIQQRQKARSNNFLENLEAKYAPQKNGKRKADFDDEPPEEAFQKTAERHKRNSAPTSRAKADRPIASPRKSKRSKK